MQQHDVMQTISHVTGPITATARPMQGEVYSVTIIHAQKGSFVLKEAAAVHQEELHAEAAVLQALEAYVPVVPQPLLIQPGYCLYTYLPGENLFTHFARAASEERPSLVAAFGRMLRMIHEWQPPLPRPSAWLTTLLDEEHRRFARLAPDYRISGTHTRFDGQPAMALLAHVPRDMPEDIVFGHGDYCLPNVIMDDGSITGVIDWSHGGYRDRRFDLATGIFNLRLHSDDSQLLAVFLGAYGYHDSVESLDVFEQLHAISCAGWE